MNSFFLATEGASDFICIFSFRIREIEFFTNSARMLKQLQVLLSLVLLTGFSKAQEIKILNTRKEVSLRGLSVVSDRTVWVSGSGGMVSVSTDGGNNWRWMQVPAYPKSDFRSIVAFSDQEAVIASTTDPAVILRTTDGGKTWNTVFKDTAKSVFLDALDISDDYGVVVGDPENGKIFFAETTDRGMTWKKAGTSRFATTTTDETFFAASGSNIRLTPFMNRDAGYRVALVSGGKKSCLYISTGLNNTARCYSLIINQGKETSGANSIAINPADPNQAFIVGGDFSQDRFRHGNSARIQIDPFTQRSPLEPPHGYRSCVEYLNDKQLICCGQSGVDMSDDGGITWKLISNTGFHVCRKAKAGNIIFLAGPHGTIAALKL